MVDIKIDHSKFQFSLLQDYAGYLLTNRISEFTNVFISISREEKLPLLKMLNISDDEFLILLTQSNTELLSAISTDTISDHLHEKVVKWASNNLSVVDRTEVLSEDISLIAYIKRRVFSLFIADYTKDTVLQQGILREIDIFTTQEAIVYCNTYNSIQDGHLSQAYENLEFQENLLLEAQAISDIGSFYIDFVNPEKSVYTPQTYIITGIAVGAESSFMDFIHPDDGPVVKNLWQEVIEIGGPFAYSFRFKHGDIEKKLNCRGIISIDNGKILSIKGTIRDISALDRLIKKLTDSENLHKQAQQLTHLGNWSWNIGDDHVTWSDELYRIYGLDPQSEPITFDRFLSLIHPDDRDGRLKEIDETLRTGVAKDYVLKIVTPAGEVKILKGHGSVEFDSDRNPIRLMGTCQDITKEYHLKNELVTLNQSLYQKNSELTNKNKELESFNYIASHDLQEPLRKIRMFAGRLEDQAGRLPESAKQSLSRVIDSASRMQQLIADLIQFSQISADSVPLEEVSLNGLIEEVLENYADNIENGQVTFSLPEAQKVCVIPFQFVQLLSNLIGNAYKYRSEGKIAEIKITCDIISLPNERHNNQEKFVKISICDNGIGFDPEQKDKIFDLFKRLHSHNKYSGTGIGLAICKKIVQNHNGFINAESTPNQGSNFHVYIPQLQ